MHPKARDSFCKTVSSLSLCPFLLYHMTEIYVTTYCLQAYLPHTGASPECGLMDVPASDVLCRCGNIPEIDRVLLCRSGCTFRLLTFLFSRGEGFWCFAALVTANHTKPGGRMRKLALDLFAKLRFFAEVEFGLQLQCNDNKRSTSVDLEIWFRHQAFLMIFPPTNVDLRLKGV